MRAACTSSIHYCAVLQGLSLRGTPLAEGGVRKGGLYVETGIVAAAYRRARRVLAPSTDRLRLYLSRYGLDTPVWTRMPLELPKIDGRLHMEPALRARIGEPRDP